jgi:hypothetical protein
MLFEEVVSVSARGRDGFWKTSPDSVNETQAFNRRP